MTHSASPFRLTQLAAAIAGVLLTGTASAQLTCPPGGNGTLTCSLSDQYWSPVTVTPPSGFNSPVPVMNVTTSSPISAGVTAYTPAGLSVLAFGNPGNTNSLNGYSAAGLNVNNSGGVILSSSGPFFTNGNLYGILAQMRGGDAASSSDDENGGGGGNAGTTSVVTLNNTGSVDMTQLAAVTTPGGAALAALSEGGAGAGTDDDHNPYGPGGQSAGAHITNAGAITATLMGTGRFAGIQAASNGGYGATQYNGGGNYGGGAGNVSIVNSGQVAVNWTWANGSAGSNAGLYGILAESHGGNGGDSATGGLGNGGAGGNASSAVVTLQGGSVTVNQTGTSPVTGAGVAAILLGGDGGNGLADEDYTSGGNAGNAGTITAGAPPSPPSARDTHTPTHRLHRRPCRSTTPAPASPPPAASCRHCGCGRKAVRAGANSIRAAITTVMAASAALPATPACRSSRPARRLPCRPMATTPPVCRRCSKAARAAWALLTAATRWALAAAMRAMAGRAATWGA